MKKKWIASLLVFLLVLGGCTPQTKETTPLASVTNLNENGIVKKEQLATISGKKKVYTFKGTAGTIQYQWLYQGKQIQNPVDQHLKVTFQEGLQEIKEAANQANEALGVKIEKMTLAETPILEIYLPKKWQADKVLLVRKINGKLQTLKESQPQISFAGKQTKLSFTVLESGVQYYLIGGKTKAEMEKASAKITSSSLAKQITQSSTAQQEVDQDSTQETIHPEAETLKQETSSVASSQTDSKEEPEKMVTVSISASALLKNREKLKKEKQAFLPKDGWILVPTQVVLKENDSVYDILVRTTKQVGIQMEASWTPMYDAYYVEGINQLYEFDAGNLSGWMYQVNGWVPNYGASKYRDLQAGDQIDWLYTIELGTDLNSGGE